VANDIAISNILSADVQQFIREHERDDIRELVLKHTTSHGLPIAIIADQIAGRRKAKEKLPLFSETSGIIYPPGLNLEQSSSQQTALFKNTLLDGIHPKHRCIDLTGGFGVDSYFFSKIFEEVLYIEPNEKLQRIVEHNHTQLGATNIVHRSGTAGQFLNDAKSSHEKADLVYIDPSRRTKTNQKVFSLTECEPDVTTLLSAIFQVTDTLLIKASPLLDLHQGLTELKFVQKIIVVAVDNEVKELLYFCFRDFAGEPVVHAVNLAKGHTEQVTFSIADERTARVTYGDPQKYLYEPNAALLKAGAFKMIAQKFQLDKLHPSTHMYTSPSLLENFPGRIFEIIEPVKPSSKSLTILFPDGKANVTTRNYPLSVEELKKKTKLKDGGANYLIGFSGQREKFLVAARRLK